jgi:hypothetical protein
MGEKDLFDWVVDGWSTEFNDGDLTPNGWLSIRWTGEGGPVSRVLEVTFEDVHNQVTTERYLVKRIKE